MKKIISQTQRKFKSILLVLAILLVTYGGFAQPTFYSPSNADFAYAATVTNAPTWMNNAVFRGGNNLVTAVAWDEGTGVVYVQARYNAATGGPVTILAPNTGFSGVRHPDLVIGADNVGLYCGVVYTAYGTTNQIFMTRYNISNLGVLGAPCTRQISASVGGVGDAHIDLINKFNNPNLTRNDFVIAWEDMDCTQVATYGVTACKGTLNTFCNPNVITYSGCINGAGIDGTMVDVAGIERDLLPVNNIALFAYVDPNNNNTLYYNEWNVDLLAVAGETTLDNNVNGLDYPRIDGIDPNTMNGNVNDALYVIDYRYYDNAAWQVKQINNINAGGGGDEITSYYSPTYTQDNYSPVVACFDGAKGYNVAYCTSILNGATSSEVFSEMIDHSGAAAGDILPAPATPYIYIVNTNNNTTGTCAPAALSCAYSIVATNPIANDNFVCWVNLNTSGSPVIYCKTCNTTLAYKATGMGSEAITSNEWTVKPNPASDVLELQNDRQTADYSICDVLGRQQMKGALKEQNELDVSALAKGMYILTIYNEDRSLQEVKFVKE